MDRSVGFGTLRPSKGSCTKNDLTVCPTIDFLCPVHISTIPYSATRCLFTSTPVVIERMHGGPCSHPLRHPFLVPASFAGPLHGLVVVSLDLEVRYPTVALRGGNLAMAQEILDGRQVRVGIEKLRGHGVAKPMA